MRIIPLKFKKSTGLPPGTPVFIGERKLDKTKISVIDYDQEEIIEKDIEDVGECISYKDKPSVSWINVDGIHDVEVIQDIGEQFGLHSLVLEDIVDTTQRPKIEDHGEYLYIVLKMLCQNEKEEDPRAEQVSIIVGRNYVMTFQEIEGDVFDALRERIRSGKGRVRRKGADYLAYTIIDSIVDHHFLILESFGERIEELEESVTENPKPEMMQKIHNLKRQMIFIRKSIWPLREVINSIQREEIPLIDSSINIYFKDVYDHTIQIMEIVETYRDMLTGIHDTYLSSISNRMNEVMKVLTIIATIFIPLTFIAGVYGMNFKNMPELGWRWGYLSVWILIAITAVLMVLLFRRKKWL